MGRPATSGSFRLGQSGNLAGRPKGRTPTQQAIADVRELAREHTVEAIDTLVSIATNTKYPAAASVSGRPPGYAGVGASVMSPCQEGESPSDVKS